MQTASILREIKKVSKKPETSRPPSDLGSSPLSRKPKAPDLDDIKEVSPLPSNSEIVNPFKIEKKNRQKANSETSEEDIFAYERPKSGFLESEVDYEDFDEENLFDDLNTRYDSQVSGKDDDDDDDDESYF